MKYKVLITDRDQVINTETGKLHEDEGFAKLDSIYRQLVDIEADNKKEALQKALDQYEVKYGFSEVIAEIVD